MKKPHLPEKTRLMDEVNEGLPKPFSIVVKQPEMRSLVIAGAGQKTGTFRTGDPTV
ncbi:TPA: hypothetical protein JTP58_005822 [Escherichia coli]|uniref:hypothetical protein n=1 Tax=Escherichia coli TaxID=562 RepID=UPI0015E194EE|nr:hypothetical protein [Escherichia coli]MCA8626120.1 hypothetical protein [Escherichia coli]HBB7147626.1 hypothetical protein [Escherichia coli]HBB8963381.1 hypothetical protein [Escherichia coli]HBC0758183.1 hypothetical protein [Escherichia coli]HCN8576604.1 hypothetical protein [Escherichia coli]